jgi:hypothetical protein
VAQAHASGHSWGEIAQAERLADGEPDWLTILEAGVGEVRGQLREQTRSERQASREAAIAERLASQYGLGVDEVWALYDASCAGNWNCVRAALRDGADRRGGGKPEN